MSVSEFSVVYYSREDGWLIGVVEELPSISATGERMSDVRDALVRLLQERLRANRAAIEEQMRGKTAVWRESVRPEAPVNSASMRIALPPGNAVIQRAEIHREHPAIRTPFTGVHVRPGRRGAPIISFVPEVRGALSEAETIPRAEANLQKAVGLVLASEFKSEWDWWFSSEPARIRGTAGEEAHLLAVAPLPFSWPGAANGEGT